MTATVFVGIADVKTTGQAALTAAGLCAPSRRSPPRRARRLLNAQVLRVMVNRARPGKWRMRRAVDPAAQ